MLTYRPVPDLVVCKNDTPLLAEYYEEVTLVDLRYVSASYALELLGDTEYQDVLFLYSAPILNHGDSLRFG